MEISKPTTIPVKSQRHFHSSGKFGHSAQFLMDIQDIIVKIKSQTYLIGSLLFQHLW
jgi:hypothetical protein